MAKRIKTKPVVLTRKQISRREREARTAKLLYLSGAAFAVIVLLVLATGLYQQLVAGPARPVARVAGVPIRTDMYDKRVKLAQANYNANVQQMQAQLASLGSSQGGQQDFIIQYYQQQIQYLQQLSEQAPQQVLETLIDEELIRQEAKRLGITVTDEELQLEIEKQFGYDRNPPTPGSTESSTPTPITATVPITVTPEPTIAPMTEEDFRKNYADNLQALREQIKMSEAEFRDLVRTDLLRTKLTAHFGEQIPTTELQVHTRHILLPTQEAADVALARIKAGEDFATVAKEITTDEATKESGGDLGWFPVGQMDPEFEKAAFNTPVGEVSEVVQSSYGFHIIKVEEREENRPLDADILEQKKAAALDPWLESMRTSADVVRLKTFSTTQS